MGSDPKNPTGGVVVAIAAKNCMSSMHGMQLEKAIVGRMVARCLSEEEEERAGEKGGEEVKGRGIYKRCKGILVFCWFMMY